MEILKKVNLVNCKTRDFPWEAGNNKPFYESVRPILTLKANLKYSGEGTKDSPYVLYE